jgi:hypothetical protein
VGGPRARGSETVGLRWPLLLATLLLAGCALRAPRPRVLRATTAGELLAELAGRRAAVTSLRARVRLHAGLVGAWTRQALLVRRPDLVRIDVFSPVGVAYALGARGALLWAYQPGTATRYEGRATPANLTRLLGAPIAAADVVDVLLGVPPVRTAVGPPILSTTPAGEYRLSLPLEGGVETIWFTGDTLAVVRAEETEGASVRLRVVFGDHQDGFPRSLEVEAPAAGTAVKLVYGAVEPNASVDPALFEPPPAERVLPLEAAMAPASEAP